MAYTPPREDASKNDWKSQVKRKESVLLRKKISKSSANSAKDGKRVRSRGIGLVRERGGGRSRGKKKRTLRDT